MTRQLLRRLEGDVSPCQKRKFYAAAREFYVTATRYDAFDHLPLNDPVLQNPVLYIC